jgi:pimeloyl-ACP methyl ester carboxylesterase
MAPPPTHPEHVVLLHGLARTRRCMETMGRHLAAAGFRVHNLGYPSRRARIEDLAARVLPPAIRACRREAAGRIHFVTHSMGGLLVRWYLGRQPVLEAGRVVMLSPPNRGSEVVDLLRPRRWFQALMGPAAGQMGTAGDGLARRLGPVGFELGVITGDRALDPIGALIIPGADDGRVAVERARVEGMADFRVIHATHAFIMRHPEAIRLTIRFLRTGRFGTPRHSRACG